ncbi:tryptophan synthase subunit alpha [Candidatus Aminicenantes bacterium AC-335-A11]|nr:tryptophan synthase subunit alpha [SCandidatus Aminicenantes bacterium Aminicenantia_JdfR_composite]MCP2597087.1 tryptophan synthase subunit alpha [Candidatus Aminicenantes bacterium AC-335-G13]MCP2605680.1 tryptophan synthase subunit alpha [Candidatus Aminicenantes bacterium AC-335-O07]MCP2606343.1 tryptophan synthase subunit alpha [Candidatus Aminicenantes bacterium AC-708-I09]MCP2618708.1 tryptophan synthase subunit alpha [Candidatus Aminicenantes bacterium AC-335-A11]
MSEIENRFKLILNENRKAFIPYFTAFYPSPELFRELIRIADRTGADFIEIGLPFSDPLADGKTIQFSSQWVLEKGFSLSGLLKELYYLKKEIKASLILMSYLNPLLKRGIKSLAKELKECGVDGIVIPDLPFEESIYINEIFKSNDIDLIYLIAPTSSEQRISQIDRWARGFIYLVSIIGVTGMRENLPNYLNEYVRRVKNLISKPLCIGFGISNPNQARRIAQISDGVIVGSALMNLIKENLNEKNLLDKFQKFIQELRRSV